MSDLDNGIDYHSPGMCVHDDVFSHLQDIGYASLSQEKRRFSVPRPLALDRDTPARAPIGATHERRSTPGATSERDAIPHAPVATPCFDHIYETVRTR